MTDILIVDDERSMREFLSILLEREGYNVLIAENVTSALLLLESHAPSVVLTDIRMGKENGLDLLRTVKEQASDTEVVMMTAHATAENAIESMKQGAYDYLIKPFKVEKVKVVIAKAAEKAELRRENVRLKQSRFDQDSFSGIVGRSAPMRRIFSMIQRVAKARANILVTGESGTGKELVARALHNNSALKDGPFIPVNCGAIPGELLESELFGHVKGAFTGASREKEGLFHAASDGSIFLDEVGELPLSMQVKLLRVLQEKKVKRVGGVSEESVNCRVIAATNKNLREMVQERTFREDLYYRLNVVEIPLPPLRERMDDLPLLLEFFVQRYGQENGLELAGIEEDAVAALMRYEFPGNIRELENIVERMVTLEAGPWLSKASLPYHMIQERQFNQLADDFEIPEEGVELEAMVERLERSLLLKALEKTGGVRKAAADLLGISFRSIRYRLDKYGIE